MSYFLEARQIVPATLDEVWNFFSLPANLNSITPPSLHFQILSPEEPTTYSGQILRYRIRILPLVYVPWLTEIKHVVPGVSFVDEQRLGPYKFWYHIHQFHPVEQGVEIVDRVHYAVGYSFLGKAIHTLWVRRQLTHIFDYRREAITRHFGSVGDSLQATRPMTARKKG